MNSIREILSECEQLHLLQFWEELSDDEKEVLLNDIRAINLKEAIKFFDQVNQKDVNNEKLCTQLKPIPDEFYGSVKRTDVSELESYRNEGLQQISNNNVGVLLLAGGQGTRLGVTDPKGMFNVGLPSGKSLFQIQAERILKLQNLAKIKFSKSCDIPWYIMTSPATTKKTKEFFIKHNYFGLNENNVIMFEQSVLPCFDFDGKILLEKKFKVAKSPDGNGGLYKALKENKILEDMSKRNIKYLHAYCVDNILVRVADPVFIGYCIKKKADCGAKVVEKKMPQEAIGVVCIVDGKPQVVEYSEISPDMAEKKISDGSLMFKAGNICNHFFTFEFLKKFSYESENQMKLHRADKKIICIDSKSNIIQPSKPNGVKIEKFVFDIFPFAKNFVIWEVNRDEEFSPLKNAYAANNDCNPQTAKEALSNLHKNFIEKIGGKVCIDGPFEISPLLSYAGEGLDEYIGKEIKCEILYSPSEKEICSENGYH